MSQSAIDYCYQYMNDFRQRYPDKKLPTEIYLTNEQYLDIISNAAFLSPFAMRPIPPVSSKTNIANYGFFGKNHTIESVTYDFHAPEYLKALEQWEKDFSEIQKKYPCGKIFGMKIIIKEKQDDNT